MIWVVDTCIILDILDRHAEFAKSSSLAIQSKLGDITNENLYRETAMKGTKAIKQ